MTVSCASSRAPTTMSCSESKLSVRAYRNCRRPFRWRWKWARASKTSRSPSTPIRRSAKLFTSRRSRRWDIRCIFDGCALVDARPPVLNTAFPTLREPPDGVATDFLRGVLAEYEAAHRLAHHRRSAVPRGRHPPKPHEPQRLHNLRDDV